MLNLCINSSSVKLIIFILDANGGAMLRYTSHSRTTWVRFVCLLVWLSWLFSLKRVSRLSWRWIPVKFRSTSLFLLPAQHFVKFPVSSLEPNSSLEWRKVFYGLSASSPPSIPSSSLSVHQTLILFLSEERHFVGWVPYPGLMTRPRPEPKWVNLPPLPPPANL